MIKLYKKNVLGKKITDLNIIPDCAGRFQELSIIFNTFEGSYFSLGDMCDRGINSKSVFDFFKDHSAILGNHEHMMIDFCESQDFYGPMLWLYNGGANTVLSFIDDYSKKVHFISLVNKMFKINKTIDLNVKNNKDLFIELDQTNIEIKKIVLESIPKEYLEWLKNLPLYYETNELILTHAPIFKYKSIEDACSIGQNCFDQLYEESVLFNRTSIRPYKDKIQFYGHESNENPVISLINNQIIGIGLDCSTAHKLFVYVGKEDSLYYIDYFSTEFDPNLFVIKK